jgi:hypothetical protein
MVDRNLGVCLPRLSVLVSIEADRPGAWFLDPLGSYQAWFPGIQFSRDFERVKSPGTPTEVRFVLVSFVG